MSECNVGLSCFFEKDNIFVLFFIAGSWKISEALSRRCLPKPKEPISVYTSILETLGTFNNIHKSLIIEELYPDLWLNLYRRIMNKNCKKIKRN